MRILLSCLFALALSAHAQSTAPVPVVADSPETVRPLAVGERAPTAVLPSREGRDVELARLFAAKPTVLVFYRGGWCPYCNKHLAALGEAEVDLVRLGYQIVAVSPDPIEKIVDTANTHHLHYQLLSDRTHLVARAYQVAYRISRDAGAGFKENGIDLPILPDTDSFWLPVPTAFIVNRQGIIRFVYSNPDPSVRIGPDELIAAAKQALVSQ